MKTFLGYLRATLVGGLFFLLPLAIAIYIFGRLFKSVSAIGAPLAETLPFPRQVVGFAVADLLAAFALIVACLLAGLIARTSLGRRITQSAENMILKKVPGYTLLRSATREGTLGPGARAETALARLEDAWVLAFIVERHPDGMLTVFVPSAPTPAAGTIYYLPEDRVRRLDLPVGQAVKLVMQLGVGSAELLQGKLDPPRSG